MLLVMISLTVSIPKSPLDAEFDTEQTGSIIGRIDDIISKEGKMTLILSNAFFQKEGETTKYSLEKILVYTEDKNVYLGNQVLVKGVLKKFLLPTNPGEFNSYYYYNSKGIHYCMMEGNVFVLDAKKDWVKVYLQIGRKSIQKVYDTWLLEDQAATLSAMFLGDKSGLSDNTKRLYQKNGMGHLLAISGLHVSLIGMGVYQILLKTIKRKKIAIIIAMISVVLYGIMTGFSISTNRAVIMLLICFTGILIGRTYDMLSAAALSATIILAFHPLEIRNSGFLLSFGAILGIAIIYPMFCQSIQNFEFPQWMNSIISAILISISIQLMTLPILLNSYYEYSFLCILINLIVLPLMSLLAAFSVTAGILGMIWSKLAVLFTGGIYVILKLYEIIACIGLKCPYATVIKGKPKTGFFVMYYIILFVVCVLWKYTKKRWVWLLLFFLLLIPVLPKNPGMQVTFLDVGQGDSIYIETKEGLHILVDGGSSTKSKVGQYVLEPFLKSQGCQKLDYVFLTHMDADHINGVMELIEFTDFGGVSIENLVLGLGIEQDEAYEKLLKLVRKHGINLQFIKRNQSLNQGPLHMHCINPSGYKDSMDKNENSIGLEVSYGEFSMVLTGDMEESEKDAMRYLEKEYYQILKVGHHGSNSSSSLSFLQRVKPMYAIISCGKKNRYGHPHPDTLERLTDINARIFYTKTGGAVIVKTDGKKFVLDYF